MLSNGVECNDSRKGRNLIMRLFHNKSLVLTASVAISFALVLVVGIMSALNYLDNKRSYTEQIDHITKAVGGQLETQTELLIEAAEQLAANNVSGDSFAILEEQLNAVVKSDPRIMSAYLSLPDIVERDGKKYLTTLQADTASQEIAPPGYDYEMPPTYEAAVKEAMQEGSSRSEPVADLGMVWISSFYTVKDSEGNVLALLELDNDYTKLKKDQSRMLMNSIGIGLLVALLALAMMIPATAYALRPLRELAASAKRAAEGDLTIRVPFRGDNEIGRTAAAFNHMMDELRRLVANIQSTSRQVASSAGELQESATQTARAAQEIAVSMQTVSSGSEFQLRNAGDCQASMTEMIVGIDRIAESSQLVAELASTSNERAVAGESVMSRTVEQMQSIERELTGTVANMKELERLSGNIGEIMGLIREVAGQTNLLALNASIEAARAGEHGKGFAVVAHEIRKLAERSRASSDQIDAILQGIRTYTEQTVASMEHAVEEARQGTSVSVEAGAAFRHIVQSVRQVSEQVHEVSATAEQLSAESEQVDRALMELMRVANQSSIDSAGVAASSEEQAASMEQVSGLTEQLRALANSLDQAIQRFRV